MKKLIKKIKEKLNNEINYMALGLPSVSPFHKKKTIIIYMPTPAP